MQFPRFENFLFIPDSTKSLAGKLHELEESLCFEKNTFVLLPYQNPQNKKPIQRFYKIKNTVLFDFSRFLKKEGKQVPLPLKSKTTKEDYLKKIAELKNHIQKGNIYEINYCVQFFSEAATIYPLEIFAQLHVLAKAPYSALLKLKEEYIISASPELFLKKEGSMLFTKPIKGTIKRGKDKEEDETLKYELQNNIKERTENVMAVDVARNDLSLFAEKGSVHVNKLYNIESFETVHQMVSTVSCTIKENTSFEKILDATFPMASMTGAPKLRAMTLIDQFEDFERMAYSGAMGLIDEKGDYSLSVIIRSIFYNQQTKKLSIAVGGAITYLSDPEKEYEECLLKANALLQVLNAKIV